MKESCKVRKWHMREFQQARGETAGKIQEHWWMVVGASESRWQGPRHQRREGNEKHLWKSLSSVFLLETLWLHWQTLHVEKKKKQVSRSLTMFQLTNIFNHVNLKNTDLRIIWIICLKYRFWFSFQTATMKFLKWRPRKLCVEQLFCEQSNLRNSNWRIHLVASSGIANWQCLNP